MRALLWRSDGVTALVEVPEPPPYYWRIPELVELHNTWTSSAESYAATATWRERVFERRKPVADRWARWDVAHYVEVP